MSDENEIRPSEDPIAINESAGEGQMDNANASQGSIQNRGQGGLHQKSGGIDRVDARDGTGSTGPGKANDAE